MSIEMILPKEWIMASIGNIATLINGDRGKNYPSQEEQLSSGYCLFLNTPNVRKGYFDFSERKFISENQHLSLSNGTLIKNDIVLTIRGTLGNCALYSNVTNSKWPIVRINSAMMILRPSKLISSNYLMWICRSPTFLLWAQKNHRGTAQPHLRATDIENVSLALPALAEQHQTAQKLDELLAQVDAIKARLDAIPVILKRFRQSVLSAAVSGKLTEEWRGNAELINWKEYSLLQLVNKPSYGSSAKSDREGKTPVLRMGNIQNGKIDWSDLVYSSNDDEIKKYTLEKNDVLFNRTNSPELVGKTAIYKGEQKAIYAGYLIKIRCSAHLDPDFLNFTLNSPQAKDYCMSVKTDGVSQSNINAQKIGAYIINCPPTEEQTEIVRRVEQFFAFADQIEQRVNNAKVRVDKLTQSILAKAFRGELTADWRAEHPELISGENSAEALLAKIQAAKEVLGGKKKKGKAV